MPRPIWNSEAVLRALSSSSPVIEALKLVPESWSQTPSLRLRRCHQCGLYYIDDLLPYAPLELCSYWGCGVAWPSTTYIATSLSSGTTWSTITNRKACFLGGITWSSITDSIACFLGGAVRSTITNSIACFLVCATGRTITNKGAGFSGSIVGSTTITAYQKAINFDRFLWSSSLPKTLPTTNTGNYYYYYY